MEVFVPDIYKKDIYSIDYKKLKHNGIKCILFDLDNTISPYNEKVPSKKSVELFEKIKKMGFKLILFSNSGKRRTSSFKEILGIDTFYHARKPNTKKLEKILKDYKFNESEVVIIGDQIMTDVVVGNTVGITTILVNPISKKEIIFTKFNRRREKRIIKKLSKLDLFYRGKYYE